MKNIAIVVVYSSYRLANILAISAALQLHSVVVHAHVTPTDLANT